MLDYVKITKEVWRKLTPRHRSQLLKGSDLDQIDETKGWSKLPLEQQKAIIKHLFPNATVVRESNID